MNSSMQGTDLKKLLQVSTTHESGTFEDFAQSYVLPRVMTQQIEDRNPFIIINSAALPQTTRDKALVKARIRSCVTKIQHARTAERRRHLLKLGSTKLSRLCSHCEKSHNLTSLCTCIRNVGNTKDPFNALPVALTEQDHRVVDFYIHTAIPIFYNALPDQKLTFNYFRDVTWHLSLTNPLAFRSAVLDAVACILLQQQGANPAQTEMQYLERQISRTLREVRKYFSIPNSHTSDAALFICTSQVSFGRFYGLLTGNDTSHAHLVMAKKIFNDRGGVKGFLSNPKLMTCYFMTVFRALINPSSSSSVNKGYMGGSLSQLPSPKDRPDQDVRTLSDSLSIFLQQARALYAMRFKILTGSLCFSLLSASSTLYPCLSRVVAYWTSAHLSSSSTNCDYDTRQQRVRESVRHHLDTRGLVTILYLHQVFWEYRQSVQRMASLSNDLQKRSSEAGLDRQPNIETIDQVICYPPHDKAELEPHYDRLGQVEMLLNAISLLDMQRRRALWKLLASMLSPGEQE